ncbi:MULTISPECIES: hypothetical protein [unclassified Xanthomonas]|uniref:hypothetical protein n=1 Tax=unclassified Xanthomonas TaxID=2643310 RepID=UPI001619731A|nr:MULTISPECIES: hypothetical protein [unclassified Xanthomonas]MBB4130047.1 hypothetical protein [Xanthomonas sp. 3075]MBB5865236.1 hypothetical protein [Xanthomonas sp. 3058]
MKIALVVSLLLGCSAASGIAHAAQAADPQTLSAAATGARFRSGTETFRMLPATVITQKISAVDAKPRSGPSGVARAGSATPSPGGKVLARIGNFLVVLDPPVSAARSQTATPERTLAAAVNERNDRVVLVRPQVKLTGTTPATATALAGRTGGNIVYASRVDGSAVIAYDSIEQAQRAATQLQGSNGITQASLVVMQSVRQPM